MTRLEENCFRYFPARLASNYPHYIVGCNKLCKDVGTCVRDDVTGSQMKLLLAGVQPSRALAKGIDPVTELVVKKHMWRQELDAQLSHLRGRDRRDTADTLHSYNKFLTHGKSGALISERKVKFIKHVGKDPDANFDGCCNWYYYGGQLNHFEIGGNVIVASVQGNKSDSLYFVPLSKKGQWSANLDAAAVVSPVCGKTIFQVVSSELGHIVARCRNCINCYKVELEQDVIVGRKCFTASSKEPFVCVDVASKYREQICSVHMDNNLCIWDMNTQSELSEHVFHHCGSNMREKWSAAAFGVSPHSLYYSDRYCVRCFDLREGLSKHVACWCIGGSSLVESCECIFNMVPSAECWNNVHLGTTHHMLVLDARKNHNVVSAECWTHMLRTPPLYGCCTPGEKEFVVMASQESSEVEVFSSGSLVPVMMQSFADCLRNSNSCGYSLEPSAQQRFKLSISGLTCITRDTGKLPTVLVQTAAGDIFAHELHRQADVSLPELINLDVHIPRDCSRSLEVSNVLDMSLLHAALKGSDDNVTQECPGEAVSLADKRFAWIKSKKKLLLYRDLLAPAILDTWDIDAMEEWKESGKKMTSDINDIPPDVRRKAKQLLQDLQ